MALVQRAERLEVRTTSAQKRLIERAAELRGTSVTDFVVSNIQAAAAETIREFESHPCFCAMKLGKSLLRLCSIRLSRMKH